MNATHEWRSVVGYEGVYEVSSAGDVRRIRPYNSVKAGAILTGFISDGYRRVLLSRENQHRKWFVHDLVCEAFHGPRPAANYEAAHGDGCRTNNDAANLRWATRKENADDMVAHGTRMQGEGHPVSKLTEAAVIEIFRAERTGTPRAEIAQHYNVTQANISYILQRRTWRHVEVPDA